MLTSKEKLLPRFCTIWTDLINKLLECVFSCDGQPLAKINNLGCVHSYCHSSARLFVGGVRKDLFTHKTIEDCRLLLMVTILGDPSLHKFLIQSAFHLK